MFKINEKDINSLKRDWQLHGQSFLVHFWGEWHSGTTRYIQNQKFSGSNLTDTLGHAVVTNVTTRLPVGFGAYLK